MNDYIRYVLATYILSGEFDRQVGEEWVFDDTYQDIVRTSVLAAFGQHEIVVNPELYDYYFEEIFSEIVAANGVIYDGDEYTGQWFRFVTPIKNQILDQIIRANPVHQLLARLGKAAPVALKRALEKIIIEGQADPIINFDADDLVNINIPASDRIVSLDHNQADELEKVASDLIEKVNQENSIGEDASLRQIILGQLRAGRELIRAQVFNAQIMRLMMIDTLKKLVEAYQGHVIAATAATLMEMLIRHLAGPT